MGDSQRGRKEWDTTELLNNKTLVTATAPSQNGRSLPPNSGKYLLQFNTLSCKRMRRNNTSIPGPHLFAPKTALNFRLAKSTELVAWTRFESTRTQLSPQWIVGSESRAPSA